MIIYTPDTDSNTGNVEKWIRLDSNTGVSIEHILFEPEWKSVDYWTPIEIQKLFND